MIFQPVEILDYTGHCKFPVRVEPKLDGIRLTWQDGKFYSRQGNERFYPDIKQDLEAQGLNLCDSELMGTKATRYTYHIFDIYHPTMKQSARSARLKNSVTETRNVKLEPAWICESHEQIQEKFRLAIKLGYEGIVIKHLNATYGDWKHPWLRLKPVHTWDCIITGVCPGTVNDKTISALTVVLNGNHFKVGIGFTSAERKEFWKNRKTLPGQIAEIEGQEITKNGAIRFAKFKRLRPDKALTF